ncbi:integrase [Sphingomonas trueperi]|uniref:tyrosine-type recombinase/integrase n=1 Tax=Sphingomonas trueperi TaxID=53317 RepID=UPI0034898CA4
MNYRHHGKQKPSLSGFGPTPAWQRHGPNVMPRGKCWPLAGHDEEAPLASRFHQRAERDVAADLLGALIATKPAHRAAVTTPKTAGELLRAIEGFQGQPNTLAALRLLPHVFVRPDELRFAEWQDFDLDRAIWTIPAHETKMRRAHAIPLSRQALAILASIEHGADYSSHRFPSLRSVRKPMSENTINAVLRRMGYAGDEMTGHGFRAMAATLLNEMGLWHPDAVERQRAHCDSYAVRRAYTRGEYWDERVRTMQHWSDHLYFLRDGAKVLNEQFGQAAETRC